jgi:hypothetical protein
MFAGRQAIASKDPTPMELNFNNSVPKTTFARRHWLKVPIVSRRIIMPNEKENDVASGNEPQNSTKTLSPLYENLLSQIVVKIKDEPLLFVIAIAALIIGVTILGAGLGSSEIRFVVTVIALLAILVITGYYFREGHKMLNQQRKQIQVSKVSQPSSLPLHKQEVKAEDGGQVEDALQGGSGIGSQVISAKGPGSSIKNVIQASTDDSDKSKK